MPGQRIRALRERLGLSQIEFAALLGVSNVASTAGSMTGGAAACPCWCGSNAPGRMGWTPCAKSIHRRAAIFRTPCPLCLGVKPILPEVLAQLAVSPLVTIHRYRRNRQDPAGAGNRKRRPPVALTIASWFSRSRRCSRTEIRSFYAIAQALNLRVGTQAADRAADRRLCGSTDAADPRQLRASLPACREIALH